MDHIDPLAPHLKATSRFWDSECFKYSLISIVALGALSCIVLGAIAFSGARLECIGTTDAIELMATGGFIGFCVINCDPKLSIQNALDKSKKLTEGEFFVFNDAEHGTKMAIARHPPGHGGTSLKSYLDPYPIVYDPLASAYKKNYIQVTLKQLEDRDNLKE